MFGADIETEQSRQLTDEVYTKGGNKKDNVYMIRYYNINMRLFPSGFRYSN